MKPLGYLIGGSLVLASLALLGQRPANALSLQNPKKPARFSKKSWQMILQQELADLERLYPKHFGVFIKDLATGDEISHRADESWYLASTVKVPIAVEVLRQVDSGFLRLDEKVRVLPKDYVDGGNHLNRLSAGTIVTIQYLLEQMLIWSDNTASDILLDIVGIENVNALVQSISHQFSPITTLKDVRRHIYSELSPRAFELGGKDFINLKKASATEKAIRFAGLLNLQQKDLLMGSIDNAFEEYYRKGLNSAPLSEYSKVLEEVWLGEHLLPESKQFLLRTMLRTQTGRHRIKAGLARPFVFAHKTGTQFHRICDVGYIFKSSDLQSQPILIASCVRDLSDSDAEKVLKRIGQVVSQAGAW